MWQAVQAFCCSAGPGAHYDPRQDYASDAPRLAPGEHEGPDEPVEPPDFGREHTDNYAHVEAASRNFVVAVIKRTGEKLGLDITHADLTVQDVIPGLVADWNASSSGRSVQTGDRIVEVNGDAVVDYAGFVRSIQGDGELSIVFERKKIADADQRPAILEPPAGFDSADDVQGGEWAAGDDDLRRFGLDAPTVSYADGASYTGQTGDGKRHGYGLWESRTGRYEGQWLDDMQHGKGKQTWTDGREYEGHFELGKFEGPGRMIWNTPKGVQRYEGEYKDNLKNGRGKFTWADGRTYDGKWLRGKRHGRGLYMNIHSTTAMHRVGYWSNDKFERWEQSDAVNDDGGGTSSRPFDDVP